jgi:hypothetical protein
VKHSVLAFEKQMVQNLNDEEQQLLLNLLQKMKG